MDIERVRTLRGAHEGIDVTDFTLVVNAGGASTRMKAGQKALLPVPPHGTALINHVVDTLLPLAASCVVIANDLSVVEAVEAHGASGVETVPDRWPGCGPMAGIASGLARCTEWAIVVACDMPFVNPALFRHLCDLTQEENAQAARRWDVVAPTVRAYPQMMHALYHVDALPVLEGLIQTGNLKLLDLLPHMRVRHVSESEMAAFDPELRSFTNVNTDEEWRLALEHLEQD